MSNTGPRGPFDLVLQDAPTSPATTLNLVLARDEEGRPRLREYRVPAIPPRRSEGILSSSHKDPETDFIFSMDDWSDGALRPYYRDGDKRYGEANKMDARAEGVLALGMQRSTALSLMAPGTWETGTVEGWATVNGTVTAVSTAPRTGTYHLRILKEASFAGGASFTIANASGLVGRTLYLIGYARRGDSGSLTAAQITFYKDSISGPNLLTTTTPTVNSATYTYVSANSGAIPSGTTDIVVLIGNNDGTGDYSSYWDDVILYISATAQCVGVVEAAGAWYTAVGALILRWHETNDYWELVGAESNGAAATSIVSFKDRVYIGYGATQNYIYGSGTSWTQTSGGSGNDAKAHYWTVMNDRLFKSEASNTVRRSAVADPVTATNWVESYPVGESGSQITNLYMLNNGIVAATEEGLFINRDEDGIFRNVTNLFETDPDSENFDRGIVRGNWLYLTTAKQGLVRFDGWVVQDFAEIFSAPRLTAYGGRVRAITQDTQQMYLLVDTPTVDTSSTKTTRLMSLREYGDHWQLHTLCTVDIGDINTLAVAGNYLYALGRLQHSGLSNYIMSALRWKLPEKSVAPFADDITVRQLEVTGTIDLPIWHGNTPGENKALLSVDVWVEDTDAANTVAVKCGVDGEASSTSTVGTITTVTTTTPSVVNIDATSLRKTGKFWNFQLVFTRDSTQAAGAHESPKVYAFAAHFALAPTPIKAWDLYVQVGGLLRSGALDPLDKATLLSALDTLESQTFPCYMREDFDQNGADTAHNTVRIRPIERVVEREEERVRHGQAQAVPGELYHLVVQEV